MLFPLEAFLSHGSSVVLVSVAEVVIKEAEAEVGGVGGVEVERTGVEVLSVGIIDCSSETEVEDEEEEEEEFVAEEGEDKGGGEGGRGTPEPKLGVKEVELGSGGDGAIEIGE